MNKQRMGLWVAGAAMAAAAALGGCSSTTTTSTGAGTTAGTTVRTPPGSAVGAGSTTMPPVSTTAGPTPTTSGSGPSSGASGTSEFCTRIKAADQLTKATSGSTKKDKPTQQDIKAFTDALAAARDVGPAEVKDSLDTLIVAYEKYATISDDPSKESQAMEIFFDDKVLAAGTKVETVVKDQCGYELKTGDSSSTGSTDVTSPASQPPR